MTAQPDPQNPVTTAAALAATLEALLAGPEERLLSALMFTRELVRADPGDLHLVHEAASRLGDIWRNAGNLQLARLWATLAVAARVARAEHDDLLTPGDVADLDILGDTQEPSA